MSAIGHGRGRKNCALVVWETDYSTDVHDNQQRKGRRVIKSTLAVA